ncbi:DUF3826 domain-containing protein [Marinoscillum sp. MHG1-6]|uniref:DUF3826 domain-containing protein n=1 Tax=Marinoscillum sp. MHG1-6 TaxID=2959627 RepID=UPI0021571236|nr:DUF3826 domain-containing protein [Marinoscillum sp. MHG1-6]
MKKLMLTTVLTVATLWCVQAQFVDIEKVNPEYVNVLKGRTAKFLDPMELGDKYDEVQSIVIEQYCNLSAIHDSCDTRKVALRPLEISKEEKDQMIVNLENERDRKLYIRHNAYLAQLLGAGLTNEQVDQIKDGMTYSVFPNTYASFLDMIQTLTDEQKKKIWTWLYEARERAMDQSSSDDKHKMFGKYKGRINNYLSGQGYDLNAESKAWHDRMRAEGKKF